MQDDMRADLLFRALAGEEQSPSQLDDEELRALVGLGARLDALRPALAALDKGEQAFNPRFAQGLHRILVAAHPAAPREQAAASNTARAARRTAQWISRRLLSLLALMAVLVVIALAVIVQGSRQTAQVGTAASSPTRGTQPPTAKSFAASAPNRTPSARQAPSTPAPNVVAPLSLGSAPPPRAEASSTPPTANGSADVSGGAPTHMDTIVPHASVGPGSFYYRLPSTLPARLSSVPVYRVLQMPVTEAQAHGIATSFTGMRPITGGAILAFNGGDAQLRITPASGVVDYTRAPAVQAPIGPTVSLPNAQVESIARGWLVLHHLLPKKAGPLTVSVTHRGAVSTVRFVPTLELPTLGGAQIPAATVEVDETGNAVGAHVAWASLEPAGTAMILSPSAATSGGGAPNATDGNSTQTGAPLIMVKRVTLSYELEGRDSSLALRPVYQLTGTLEGKPMTQIVPASRDTK